MSKNRTQSFAPGRITEFELPDPLQALKVELLQGFRNVLRQEFNRFSEKRPLPLLAVDGVAERLSVSKRTVERLIEDGEIDPIWIRGQRRFCQKEVRDYIRRSAGGQS